MYVLKNEQIEDFDEIIFKLVCTGNTKIAKIFVRNYLKNFGGQLLE